MWLNSPRPEAESGTFATVDWVLLAALIVFVGLMAAVVVLTSDRADDKKRPTKG